METISLCLSLSFSERRQGCSVFFCASSGMPHLTLSIVRDVPTLSEYRLGCSVFFSHVLIRCSWYHLLFTCRIFSYYFVSVLIFLSAKGGSPGRPIFLMIFGIPRGYCARLFGSSRYISGGWARSHAWSEVAGRAAGFDPPGLREAPGLAHQGPPHPSLLYLDSQVRQVYGYSSISVSCLAN